MTNYVRDLQLELFVNYCSMVYVSADNRLEAREMRAALGAIWPFLCDTGRDLLRELQMVDETDPIHGKIYIPYTFILDGDLTIYKIYNGWWYTGRPTVEEIRMDFRALMSKRKDWVYSADQKQPAPHDED